MASPAPTQEEHSQGKQCFRNQLAAAVRSIHWSYAIFWSSSSRQPGVLTWNDGYYNGEIKTRKITNSMDLKADQTGSRRSEQLRELYESLLSSDGNNQQMRRSTASLSPEDLTDTEWYYLVGMSFTFRPGRGLPGKSFASNEHIWLCNAQFADSKTFPRSLLAKNASIQTVVCIPFMSGVLELGTTDSILEDPALVKRITSSFWELTFPICSEQSLSIPSVIEREEEMECENLDRIIIETVGLREHTSAEVGSPATSFALQANTPCIDTEQIKNKMEESTSIYEELYMNSPEDPILDALQGGNDSNLISLDVKSDTSHLTNAAAVRNCKEINTLLSCFLDGSRVSSFTVWHRDSDVPRPHSGAPQKLLKKVLNTSAWMKGDNPIRPQEHRLHNQDWKPAGVDLSSNHVLSERRRREKINEKFLILRSLVPSMNKVDKASILAGTIAYVKKLEQRVEELESCREVLDLDPDIAERTCGNYCHRKTLNKKNVSATKRKASEIGDAGMVHHWVFSEDEPIDVDVTVIDKEVHLEMQCQWREFLMPQVFEAIRSVHLDPLSVQSSTADGMLVLTIRAKFVSSAMAAPGTIKQALQSAVGKC